MNKLNAAYRPPSRPRMTDAEYAVLRTFDTETFPTLREVVVFNVTDGPPANRGPWLSYKLPRKEGYAARRVHPETFKSLVDKEWLVYVPLCRAWVATVAGQAAYDRVKDWRSR